MSATPSASVDFSSAPGIALQSSEVVPDKLYDLDGDGDADNALDALGSQAAVFSMALTAMFNTALEPGVRNLAHAP